MLGDARRLKMIVLTTQGSSLGQVRGLSLGQGRRVSLGIRVWWISKMRRKSKIWWISKGICSRKAQGKQIGRVGVWDSSRIAQGKRIGRVGVCHRRFLAVGLVQHIGLVEHMATTMKNTPRVERNGKVLRKKRGIRRSRARISIWPRSTGRSSGITSFWCTAPRLGTQGSCPLGLTLKIYVRTWMPAGKIGAAGPRANPRESAGSIM